MRRRLGPPQKNGMSRFSGSSRVATRTVRPYISGRMSKDAIESLATGAENFSQNCCTCLEDCEEQIRQQPWTSVLIAAAIGYLLHFLPVGRILTSIISSLLALVKPALIVLGVLKIVSCVSDGKTASK
jgi:ElaB/YqjD/DUF883 family membrane-anchored ribosome-binding protein